MDFAELLTSAEDFAAHLASVKASMAPPSVGWYPPMLPGHVEMLDRLLVGEHRRLLEAPGEGGVADIGAADGDFGFFLERAGFDVDLFDGADRPLLLKEALGSKAEVHHVHLDYEFELPRTYELAFLLHVLYHLRNPMLALETLSHFAHHCILSTRVADFATSRRRFRRRTEMRDAPLAYLLEASELNPGDNSSFWIFSETALLRLVSRSGWDVLAHVVVGDRSAGASDMDQPRAWCLLRSRELSGLPTAP